MKQRAKVMTDMRRKGFMIDAAHIQKETEGIGAQIKA